MEEKSGKRTTQFLVFSFLLVTILCIFIFSFLALYMNRRTVDTVSQIGTSYMHGMGEQTAKQFENRTTLRLSQLKNLSKFFTAKDVTSEEELREKLQYEAAAQDFSYLAFYLEDGTLDMIFGKQIKVIEPDPSGETFLEEQTQVVEGIDPWGLHLVLFGVPVDYPMEDGSHCAALVAGLPMDEISNRLSLEVENTVYSHIIHRNGDFVLQSGRIESRNYFDYLRLIYLEDEEEDGEIYIQDMQAHMDAREDYSSVLDVNGERRHIHCLALPGCEWYLITVMPFGTLNSAMDDLSRQWLLMAAAGCAILILVIYLIFREYFRITNGQMKRLDEARKEAIHANRAKSEFLSNMSHDIRTPMNAIVGMTAIATANIDNEEQVKSCLKKITVSSRHLLGLINDVLDMSKIESGKMELNMDRVSLRELMDGIVSIVQPQIKAKQQRFDVSIHDITSENVLCDSVRLNQVMLNFLSNAIKFTPEEGSIRVSLYEEVSPKGDDYVRIHIRVRDTGIGMAPEFKERVFDSFTREDSARVQKTEGTGLGMAITKYIIDAMKGTVEVESEPGKGTEFHVTLDLEKAEEQETQMVLPDWKMLVVDDDEILCESAVDSLKSIGVRAEWKLDGESALKAIEEEHQQSDGYHIILLDWKLPGMDGIATAREIRRRCGDDLPILLISAYDWSEIEKEARAAGISGFISKPLFKSTLYYGLRKYATPVEEAEIAEETERTDFSGKRILLAEDNDLNWEIAEALLSDLSLVLERAENGQVCVDKFAQSEPGYYQAVLMDIRMPVMNGYEAAQAIRAMERPDSDLPIIAMTADAFADDIRRCLDCGMNAHVAKPIDVTEIEKLLKKYLR